MVLTINFKARQSYLKIIELLAVRSCFAAPAIPFQLSSCFSFSSLPRSFTINSRFRFAIFFFHFSHSPCVSVCLCVCECVFALFYSTFCLCFFAPLTKPNKVWCSNLLCSLQLPVRLGFLSLLALTFFIIFLSFSAPFPLSTLLFPSFCRFLPLSLSLSHWFAFFNSIYFWIYTYLCTWDSFPLTVSNFYARPENSFYLPLSSFFFAIFLARFNENWCCKSAQRLLACLN